MRAAMRGVPRFSFQAMQHIGGAIGSMAYFLLAEPRRIAMANLDIAFGESLTLAEKRRIARSAFENFAMTMVSLFWMPRLNRRNIHDLIAWNEADLDRVRGILTNGRGVMFVGPHYGNWELMGQLMSQRGFPITTAVQQARNPVVSETINRLRGSAGLRIMPQRFAGIRILKALKRGECSLVLVDLNATRHGGAFWTDFFGLPVLTNSAIAGLAVRANAAVIPIVSIPRKGDRALAIIGEEITADAPVDDDDAIQQISRKALRFCEEIIRNDPRHWLWTYKRWKRRPSAEQGGFPYYSKYDPSRLEGVREPRGRH